MPIRRRSHLLVVGAIASCAVVGLSGCSSRADRSSPAAIAGPVLEVPADAGRGPAGEVLTQVELPPDPALPGARAWRVAYRLPRGDGTATTATALVVAPPGDPASDRPVVGWAHPTRGLADACAPSLDGPASIPDLVAWLDAGVTVVAPDYEGLGGPGLHPYLVGPSEGRSLLWALVAARDIDPAGVGPESPVVLYGFSQGGHAAGFAARMADDEVPDLQLWGTAIAAPVSDVASFARRAEARPDQIGVLLAIVGGQRAAHPSLDPSLVLTDEGVAALDSLGGACIGEVVEAAAGPVEEISRVPVADVPAWRDALDDDLVGAAAPASPVLVVQGDEDDTVDPADTARLVDAWCSAGVAVDHVVRTGGGHGTPAGPVAVPWLLERLEGRPAGTTCGGPPTLVDAAR